MLLQHILNALLVLLAEQCQLAMLLLLEALEHLLLLGVLWRRLLHLLLELLVLARLHLARVEELPPNLSLSLLYERERQCE